MLSQLERLRAEVDGRYATDLELQFMQDYVTSFSLRIQTYVRLQSLENTIVQQVYSQMRSLDPSLFLSSGEDVSGKWKRDTLRVLRYSAVALLLNDPDSLQERLLFWMQTIMRAFGAERSCAVTYEVMQTVTAQHLSGAQASLFLPILELNRSSLGAKVS
jgi:hypothetical protein